MNKKSDKIQIFRHEEKAAYTITMIVLVTLFSAASAFTGFNPFDAFMQQGEFWRFITIDFWPPDITKAKGLFEAILVTLEMALASTAIAAVMAFILAFYGSSVTSPSLAVTRIIRGMASFLRNIPAMVWAFILFMSFGIGTSIGFLALVIETFGFLLRAFSETIDEVGQDAIEALTASGATFAQRIAQGIIPSAMPGYISWFLYCVEVNIRSSTIVGMVGGGGVGLVLFSYLKNFRYHVAAAIILVIAVMIIMVDMLTNWLRKKVIV